MLVPYYSDVILKIENLREYCLTVANSKVIWKQISYLTMLQTWWQFAEIDLSYHYDNMVSSQRLSYFVSRLDLSKSKEEKNESKIL